MLKRIAEWFEFVFVDYFVGHPSAAWILIGLVLQAVGLFLAPGILRIIVEFVALAVLVAGCCQYAGEKGWPEAFGWLGVLGILGFIILLCLKDRRA